jgi:hypothetical protein
MGRETEEQAMSEIKQPRAEPPTTHTEHLELLRDPTGSLKWIGYYALLYVLVALILGFIFMAMLLPLTLVFASLITVYAPAHRLAGRLFGVKELPARLAKPPTRVIIREAVWVLLQLGFVAILVRSVFFIGFCNQNVICLVVRLLLK